jgi:putative flippase GtrA
MRFLIAGGSAAVVNWGTRFLLSRFLPYEAAVAGSFVFGLITGFLLMRSWVFGAAHHPIRRQAATYVVVNLLALLQTLIVSSLLARWMLPALGITRHAEALAHAAGIAVPVATSFVGHKKATFRAPKEPELEQREDAT